MRAGTSICAAVAATVVSLVAGPVFAEVVRVEVTRREPFAAGTPFGTVGAYEIIAGRLLIAVAPEHPANRRIVDLGRAPRNPDGDVEAWVDFFLLRPADPSRGNRALLYDVHNRGNKIALGTFNGGGGNDPTTLAHAGNGFLMRQGYSILWTGWSADVEPGGDRLQIDLPVATNDGDTITGRIYNEIEISVSQLYAANVLGDVEAVERSTKSHPFVWASRAYPAASLDNRRATLTVRERRADPGVEIPRDRWAFAREVDGVVVADPTSIYLEDGFRPGWLYDLVYVGKDPKVVGLGFAAVRDAVSHFRREEPWIDRALAYGGSQSGRFLHHFVYEGFNRDEGERTVFDGFLIHVAGAGKGQFNYRFAQNTRHGSHHEENLYPSDFFPFTSVLQEDPVTGQTGDMLARARAAGDVPRIFFVRTSTEYWARGGSLIHTDVRGTRDVAPDPRVRIYLINGAPHNAMAGGRTANPLNDQISTQPVMRALLHALDRWVAGSVEPPPSRYPRIGDGTLVDVSAFRETFPALPEFAVPTAAYTPLRLDPGPRWHDEGIADHVPPRIGEPYVTLVPAVDEDGNELGGIRLPDIAVPLGTYTGWNLRAPAWGAGGMLTRWMGSYLPLPRDVGERERTGDPRRSILERYPTRDAYIARYARATLGLLEAGFLLDEDVGRLLRGAFEREFWDADAGTGARD